MIRDLLTSLFSLFVVEPFQAEFNRKLAVIQAPPAIVEDVARCKRTAAPLLASRAMSDPVWGIMTVIRVSVGATTPQTVLIEAAPSCGPAIQALRPFLMGHRQT